MTAWMCASIENINSINRIIDESPEPLLWQDGAREHD